MRFPLFSSFLHTRPKLTPGGIKPVVLIVIDGWGSAPDSHGNALTQAKLPNWNRFLKDYPNTELIASGESVGLPANEVGNSEVGHLTIGVGRVIFESLLRINRSIEDDSFFRNPAFQGAAEHVLKHNSKLHLIGLVGSGNVHSSTQHLFALLEFCKRSKLQNVCLHLFTDGRDAPPHDGVNVLTKIEFTLKEQYKFAHIATLSGRYFGLDRDNRWERTQKTYEAMVLGQGISAKTATMAVSESYKAGKTDEFLEPTIITQESGKPLTVDDGDACIFFNFRVDRPRQLTKAFVIKDFESGMFIAEEEGSKSQRPHQTFVRSKIVNDLFFVTMTEYQKTIPVSSIAFPNEVVEHPLPEVISKSSYKQLHLAESEKERMVTYYMDGLRTGRFEGEDVLIVPSPKVGTYDKKPEMSLHQVIWECQHALSQNTYQVIIMNIANPDMVAHSGKLQATIKACEVVDWALGELVSDILSLDGTVFITADHGNAEELLTFDPSAFFYTTREGSMNTEHSNNPVPLMMIHTAFKGKPDLLETGSLADVAPTILSFMKLPIPKEMTGRNLLKSI